MCDPNGNPTYDAMVFGNKPQPYMTEVYARNAANPANNYVAVELFNPYPTPMNLKNYRTPT